MEFSFSETDKAVTLTLDAIYSSRNFLKNDALLAELAYEAISEECEEYGAEPLSLKDFFHKFTNILKICDMIDDVEAGKLNVQ